ncbi:CAP domain-containing protein [Agrilactobacillus yilanensis]|uniref:CAP domain-containing protein n=1 Tax=Agrilactobacillus yilanensis TaxID=2485997 RepID=A0ABW4J3R7_9LACO|nr:CAP domain-containing protein [Agrilactobacillus yilanensis]
MNKFCMLSCATLLGLSLATAKPMIPGFQTQQPHYVKAAISPGTATNAAATTTIRFSPNLDHVRALMFYAINQLRQQNGLHPLQYNQSITNAWSQTIVDRNATQSTLSHDMTDESHALNSIGYYFFGENLAMTPINTYIRSGGALLNPITNDEQLAIALVTQYYDDVGVTDYGHRKNLLNPWFTQVGMAFTKTTDANGVTRVYNSLDFAGVATAATNSAINNYVSYSSESGVNESTWPTHYTPLSETYINWQSGIYGVINDKAGLDLWTGYGQNRSYSGRVLPYGSAWKIDGTKVDSNGTLWYLVGPNQWLDSNYVNVYGW